MAEPEPPDLEGWLHKMKHKPMPLMGGWNRRWFRINQSKRQLEYFQTEADFQQHKEPSGFIELYDISSAKDFDGVSFTVETRERTFFLRADSPVEALAWLTPLQEYIRLRKIWQSNVMAMSTGSFRSKDLSPGPAEEKGYGGGFEEVEGKYAEVERRMPA
uniref:PH domain-containing protein n=1 Tax=Florenciella parvula TaxID=236787 RepID=A0A7S2FQ65_9STRA|mmetsp:Transcript_21300/g.44411  ORF Transcript_21300/g.44411 Transcript_21300/m.44411 type:complete len:160 (+) Transcript_21300:132-611(+)